MSPPKNSSSNVIIFGRTATAEKLDPEDRRGAHRRRVLKSAIATFGGRTGSIACAIRDISETGARIRADGSVNIPDTFELIIETNGFEADCEVIWRNETDIGVRFLGAPRQTAPIRKQVIDPVRPTSRSVIRRKPITS